MRFAEDRPADLRAQVATNQAGMRRMQELCHEVRRVARFTHLIEGVLDYNERTIRARIRELPEGTWSFEDQLDDDSHTPEPVPLKVTVTVRHRPKPHMVFDFAGSSAQRRAASTSSTKRCSRPWRSRSRRHSIRICGRMRRSSAS